MQSCFELSNENTLPVISDEYWSIADTIQVDDGKLSLTMVEVHNFLRVGKEDQQENAERNTFTYHCYCTSYYEYICISGSVLNTIAIIHSIYYYN